MCCNLRDPQLASRLEPQTVMTRLGEVEYLTLGTGPVILAIHGAMGGWDQSLLLAQTIGPQGFCYICPSRPGYLGTDLTVGHSCVEQGDMLAALLDAIGISRAGVIAVSGGGPSALHFALRHPTRCAGLVLASTCVHAAPARVPWSFRLRMHMMRSAWLINYLRRQAESDPLRVARRAVPDAQMLARLQADTESWQLFLATLLNPLSRMKQRLVGTRNDIDNSRTLDFALETLQAPILVAHGTADAVVPFDEHATEYARRVPKAEILALADGGHVAIFTHRTEVREHVLNFAHRHIVHEASVL